MEKKNWKQTFSMVFIGIKFYVIKWDWESGKTRLSLFACSFVLNCRNGGNCKRWEKLFLNLIIVREWPKNNFSTLSDLDNSPWCILVDPCTFKHKRLKSEKLLFSACFYASRYRMLLVNSRELGRNIFKKIDFWNTI